MFYGDPNEDHILTYEAETVRKDLAQNKFGVSYDFLVESKDKPKVKAVRKIFPQRISEAEPKNINIGGK